MNSEPSRDDQAAIGSADAIDLDALATLMQRSDPEIDEVEEAGRIDAVRRYQILDTPADGHFDRITQLAARIFQVPISIVSVVDEDRVWFKSVYGVDAEETERCPGLCASVVLGDCVWVSENASVDPRTLANPLVAGELGLRFYAGAPLITSDGHRLGALCVIDVKPRQFTERESSILADLAAVVVDELDVRLGALQTRASDLAEHTATARLAYTDHLTGTSNRRAFDVALADHSRRARRTGRDVAVAMIDVNGLKGVNDREGHQRGDLLLQTFAQCIEASFRSSDVLYRLGGDEFAIVFPVAVAQDARLIDERVKDAIAQTIDAGFPDMGASVGIALLSECGWSIDEVLAAADARMYRSKPVRLDSGR